MTNTFYKIICINATENTGHKYLKSTIYTYIYIYIYICVCVCVKKQEN